MKVLSKSRRKNHVRTEVADSKLFVMGRFRGRFAIKEEDIPLTTSRVLKYTYSNYKNESIV
jgi:hypothetical protein